jgi:hypothetical protein
VQRGVVDEADVVAGVGMGRPGLAAQFRRSPCQASHCSSSSPSTSQSIACSSLRDAQLRPAEGSTAGQVPAGIAAPDRSVPPNFEGLQLTSVEDLLYLSCVLSEADGPCLLHKPAHKGRPMIALSIRRLQSSPG